MTEPNMIVVDVDGLPVEVDEADWTEHQQDIEERVRSARTLVVGTLDDEPAPDYDALEALGDTESVPE